MFYVYVLQSLADTGLYIGYTANLRLRLVQHQRGESQATKSRRPWRLIYYEAYVCEEDAVGRERFLKSGTGHSFLRKQCQSYFRVHAARTRQAPYTAEPTGRAPYTATRTGQAPYTATRTGQAPYTAARTGQAPYTAARTGQAQYTGEPTGQAP